jgi:hypothetical protein
MDQVDRSDVLWKLKKITILMKYKYIIRFSFSSIFHKTMSAELGSIFVKFCIICKIFTKMDIFICFDSSYSFQYESILQDFYKYTKGVNIIRIFIFFNFPQNYGCWTLSSFIKFYIYAYTLTAWLLLQFSSK